MIDNIFGVLIDPDWRRGAHLEERNGVKHLNRRFPLDPEPGQPIILILTTGGPIPYDSARCSYTTDGSDPALEAGNVKVLSISPHHELQGGPVSKTVEPGAVEWDLLAWDYVRTWKLPLPPQPARTLIRYRLEAHRADNGEWVAADVGLNCGGSAFALWVDHDPVPEWAREAIVYQVFPDRFFPGDSRHWKNAKSLLDFHGGTLRGVIDKLDYIQSLGFNAIWLTPFFKTSSHHGYNASDYYTVEPRLGTHTDLKELIEKAHARGIRLILDFVANHWSRKHFTFQDAKKNPTSPYRDWYCWNHWPDDYETYASVQELPKINLNHPPARAYLLEVARHWLREGFDGYRLDFACGPSHDFWVDFRRTCREIKPDCWIFGEVIQTVPTLLSYTGIMDGTLDFHLARALRETFAFERMSLTEFETFLTGHEAYFPFGHLRPSFLDNHDEARFLHIAGDDKAKLRLAALVLYTLSGPPIVYAGTETGLSQERPMHQNGNNIFEECRLPMNWDTADTSLQDYFRQLGVLRHSHPVLWSGSRRLIHLDAVNNTYAYIRENDGDSVLVAINLSKSPHTISVQGTALRSATDWLNGIKVDVQGDTLVIQLPPESGAFICT